MISKVKSLMQVNKTHKFNKSSMSGTNFHFNLIITITASSASYLNMLEKSLKSL